MYHSPRFDRFFNIGIDFLLPLKSLLTYDFYICIYIFYIYDKTGRISIGKINPKTLNLNGVKVRVHVRVKMSEEDPREKQPRTT